MPFTPAPKFEKTKFKKNEWLQTPVGSHQIRILDESPYEVATHYVNGTYIRCLGEECPVCLNNKKIFKSNPQDYRKVKGYASRSTRYAVNVLDRTPVKVCPKCGAEVKKIGNAFPSSCSAKTDEGICNQLLTNVKPTPLNKVKIWGWGSENQDRLAGYYAANVDEDGTPISLTKYDFSILVTPAANDKKNITPSPDKSANDEVVVEKEQLFDLTNCVISLRDYEIPDFMHGTSLRDIFQARKADSIDTTEVKADGDLAEEIEDTNSSISELFKN